MSLSWEGGVYSLRALMSNVVANKVRWCRDFGISIQEEQWPCSDCLPGIMVTDMGSEYKSDTFSQIVELGVTLINLPAYRPELKGMVEKFFDVLQGLYKPYLKGKGTIEPDFQERGAHDYRKDACLTMREFETVILRYDPSLSYEEAKRKNTAIKKQIDEESECCFFSDEYSPSIENPQPDDSDPQVVTDNQLGAFYKEHCERRK